MNLLKCENLAKRIKILSGMSKDFDPLYEYRRFWDLKGIKSEGDDGWPLPFCFEEENIKKFVEYWNAKMNEVEEREI